MRKILLVALFVLLFSLGWKWNARPAAKVAGWTWDEGISYYVYVD